MFDTFRNRDTNILAYYWDVPANKMSKFHVKAIVVDKRRFYGLSQHECYSDERKCRVWLVWN